MTLPIVRLGARLGAAALALAFLAPLRPAAAQGVTTGAVIGTILDEAGAGVTGATVSLVNGSTGQRYAANARADGRYGFENVAVGGPYVVEARALGFSPGRSEAFTVRLGERRVMDVKLQRAAVELTGVTVTGEVNPVMSASRTGAQSFVSESALARLPSLSRNFTDFIQTVPQVVSANVPGAPYFVPVDGPGSVVVGEGTATTWERVQNLIGQAVIDNDEQRTVDNDLRAAGIEPGDPSLYPEQRP
jgi:hypothetical protein